MSRCSALRLQMAIRRWNRHENANEEIESSDSYGASRLSDLYGTKALYVRRNASGVNRVKLIQSSSIQKEKKYVNGTIDLANGTITDRRLRQLLSRSHEGVQIFSFRKFYFVILFLKMMTTNQLLVALAIV